MKNKFTSIPKEIADLQDSAPKPMVAFHGHPEIKQFYAGRVAAH